MTMKNVQVKSFTAIAPIATRLFNDLRALRPDFGLGVETLLNEREEEVTIDNNELALLTTLNLVLNRGGTTDAWLEPSLGKSLDLEITSKHSIAINRWLIAQDVIEKHPIRERTVLRGRVVMTKLWPLTADYLFAVEIAKNQSEVKYEPRSNLEVLDLDRVKGKSKGSEKNLEALHRLDTVAFVMAKSTLAMAEDYIYGIDAKNDKEEDSKEAEARAVIKFYRAQEGKSFYLTHTQDFRSRIYARGGYISTQACKLQKAAILFAESEEACDWEEIHIYLGRLAGNKGLNHESEQVGADIARDYYDNALMPLCLESRSILENPQQAVIRLDGCSNGIQWMSAFLNDESGKKLTNLTGSEVNDLYLTLKDKLELIDRDAAKYFVMPYSYGASVNTLSSALGVSRDTTWDYIEDTNKLLPISKYLRHVKRGAEFTEGALKWTLPDGFRVVQDYKTADRINAGTFSAVVSEFKEDSVKRELAIAPNIIHSIDGYHMRQIIRACEFDVITIHDSVGAHSSNVKAMRKIILATFVEIIESDLLNDIMRELKFRTFDKPDASNISNPYMFM